MLLIGNLRSAQLFSPWRKCKAERMFACFEQIASKCSATNTNQLNPRDPNPCWLRSCFRKANQPTLCAGWISVLYQGFPGGPDSKESAYNTGDLASVPWLGKSPGEGNGNPLQYSCLENPMDRGAWRASVHGVTKSRTWLCVPLSLFHQCWNSSWPQWFCEQGFPFGVSLGGKTEHLAYLSDTLFYTQHSSMTAQYPPSHTLFAFPLHHNPCFCSCLLD